MGATNLWEDRGNRFENFNQLFEIILILVDIVSFWGRLPYGSDPQTVCRRTVKISLFKLYKKRLVCREISDFGIVCRDRGSKCLGNTTLSERLISIQTWIILFRPRIELFSHFILESRPLRTYKKRRHSFSAQLIKINLNSKVKILKLINLDILI